MRILFEIGFAKLARAGGISCESFGNSRSKLGREFLGWKDKGGFCL